MQGTLGSLDSLKGVPLHLALESPASVWSPATGPEC